MSSMLQMYHANLAARLHPTQIGNSNPFPIGQSPASLSAIGQFWQPHGPSAHALSNLHRSAPSAMASLLGSVQHKIQHEPVRTGSCWILCWTEPRSDAIALGALRWRFESAWADGPCGCQNWPIAESEAGDWPIGNGLLFPIWVGWSLAAKLAWYICNIDDISCSI